MVDMLIKNALVLQVDRGNQIIKDGAVAVDDGRIVEVGPSNKMETTTASDVIDAHGMVLMPGLVNAHTHLSMTLFRSVADDVPGVMWLPIIWSIEKNIDPEACYVGALLGCLESIKCGVTTFADQYWHMDRVATAVQEAGLRAVLAQGILELDDSAKGERDLQEAVKFAQEWNHRAEGRITCRLVPTPSIHAPQNCFEKRELQLTT